MTWLESSPIKGILLAFIPLPIAVHSKDTKNTPLYIMDTIVNLNTCLIEPIYCHLNQ